MLSFRSRNVFKTRLDSPNQICCEQAPPESGVALFVSVSKDPEPDAAPDFPPSPECATIRRKGPMCVGRPQSLRISLEMLPNAKIDFDLVRIYHPDKVDPGIPDAIARARFQAITAAYNALRGGPAASWNDQATAPTPVARAMYKRSRNLYSGPQLSDDSWKDRIIVAGVIFAAFCFVIQSATARRAFVEDVLLRPRDGAPHKSSKSAPVEDPRLAEPEAS